MSRIVIEKETEFPHEELMHRLENMISYIKKSGLATRVFPMSGTMTITK